MNIAVYNHKDVGDAVVNRFTYTQRMLGDSNQCKAKAEALYGTGHDYRFYMDVGNYPSNRIDRPNFQNMMAAVRAGEIQVVCVMVLSIISSEVDIILDFYQELKEYGVELITAKDGKKVMDVLDKALARRNID